MIVINQRAVDGESVNQPFNLPEKLLSPAPLSFEVKYLQEPIIRTLPIRFEVYHLGKRENLNSKDFTHTWALANYFANDDSAGESINDQHVKNEEQQEIVENQGEALCQNVQIFSMRRPNSKRSNQKG